ncbi:MAG TPA: ATP-binding cassette domain-containing protein, partial [Candidatus Lambdaproteobacteria bacterium]|nr:ATP-binding cassette domain-containing protein [Candidatus Lambdaproteobacteria bacterium]
RLAYCVSLTTRRHGVYINREEVEKKFPEDDPPKTTRELNSFLAERKLEASPINISIDDFKDKNFVFPCAVPLMNGESIIALSVLKKEEDYFIKFLDPLDPQARQQEVGIDEFEKLWKNIVISVNAQRGVESKERPFDLKWFLPELWKCRYLLLCAFIISILLNILSFTPIIFIQISLDKVVGYKAVSTLYVLTAGVAVALLFNAIVGFVRDYIFNYIGDILESRIATDIFDKLLGLPLIQVQGDNINKFNTSMQSITALRNTVVMRVFKTVFDLTAVLVFVPVMFAYNFLMGLIVLGFAILMGVNKIIFNNIAGKSPEILGEVENSKSSLIRETLHGMTMLKEFEEEESERKNWRKSAAASIILRSKKNQVNSTSTEINGFLQNAMTIAIIFTGVQLVFSGDLSAGSIIAINMVAGKLTSPIIAAITLFGDRNQLFVLISHIGDIWNKGKEQMGAGVHSAISGKYLFDNISMDFGDVKALNKLSFELTPKSKVGVVGPTGAGKSTLLNMIAGTYRPTEGRMDIDGVGINQYDLSYYRSQVMLLDKNPIFFKGTIEDNMSRVTHNIGKNELAHIFALTGFDEHLQKLPEGIHTKIDENATQLAGGAASLLALSRALLANPKVLLLDEFADSLDIDTRIKLQDNFSTIASDRTIVDAQNVISHELDSISNYDKIIVLDRGKVVGQGKHENLINTCETYRLMLEKEKKLSEIGESETEVTKKISDVDKDNF